MIELINLNPECYFGMSKEMKSNKEVAKAIIAQNYLQFAVWADDNLKNEGFLLECGLSQEDIAEVMQVINEQGKENTRNGSDTKKGIFDNDTLKCKDFLVELNKCSSKEELTTGNRLK